MSRKSLAETIAYILIGVVYVSGGIVILCGYEVDTVKQVMMTVTGAIAFIGGVKINSIAKEDAAAKSNPATPPIQNAVERATQTLEQRNAARMKEIAMRLDPIIEAAAKKLEGMVRK